MVYSHTPCILNAGGSLSELSPVTEYSISLVSSFGSSSEWFISFVSSTVSVMMRNAGRSVEMMQEVERTARQFSDNELLQS